MHRTAFALSHSFLVIALVLASLIAGCAPEDPLEEIRTLQARQDFAPTVEPLRELLRVQPKDPETNLLYGRALIATRKAELALFSLREAMRDPEWKEPAGLEIAVACLITGDFNEAIAATTQILEDDPDHIQALLFRAQARAHWRNDPPLALEDAERVLELDPTKVEAYEPIILSLLALDQPTEAAERLAEAGRLVADTNAPDHVLAWHCSTSAILATDMSQEEKAEQEFNDCVERFPGMPNIVQSSVNFFDKKGDYKRSLEIMRAAVSADPTSRAFRSGLATRLVGSGRAEQVEEAEALLKAATEVDDPQAAAQAWSDLGEFFHVTGQYEKAARAFGEANDRVAEKDAQLAFRYADALVLARDFDAALEQANKLGVDAHRELIAARVAQERGQYEEALDGFIRASQLWPDNPWARYYTALAAEQVGSFDRALEEYRYSIRINAAATDSRTRAAKLIAAKGEPLDAYNTLFVQALDHPLEPEGWIFGSNLIARVSNASQLQDHLLLVAQRFPSAYPRALVSAAEGLDLKGLPAGGVELLFQPPDLDWKSDAAFPVVEKVVRLAHKANRLDRAEDFLKQFRKQAPDAKAALQEAEAILFESKGAPEAQVRTRWIELTDRYPSRPGPWVALGRISLEKDPSKAAEYLARARGLDPTRGDLARDLAEALRASGKIEEASRVLEERLEEEPTDALAAISRAEIDLARNAVSARTADWARRAVRFNRQLEDFERLTKVYRLLGDEKRAASAERATQRMRNAKEAKQADQTAPGEQASE